MMSRSVLLTVVVAVLVVHVSAHADESERLPPPATPRLGLLLGFGLGLDALGAGWNQPNPEVRDHQWESALALRARLGFAPVESLSIFGEGYLGIPVAPFMDGFAVTTAGVGVSFIRPGSPWHLSAEVRFGVGGIPEPQVQYVVPPTTEFRLWLAELGIG